MDQEINNYRKKIKNNLTERGRDRNTKRKPLTKTERKNRMRKNGRENKKD